jgi:hypothetical protein
VSGSGHGKPVRARCRWKGVDFRTFGVALKTPGHDYTASFIWNHGGEQQDDLWDETTGQSISCDQTISRNGRTYLLRINRSCVHKPRWIRAAVGSGMILGSNDSRGDNALSNKWRQSSDSDNLFSPRVRSST